MKVILIILIMTLNSILSYAGEPNTKRLLLSFLREGDYAHAGDREAIDLVLKQVLAINPGIQEGKVLDVGCGFGGTLGYMKARDFKNLYGIDINPDSIDYAKAKYRGINFIKMDALKADHLAIKFDLIILFNSAYAISDKRKLLEVLNKIANPNSILVIFDYQTKDEKALAVKDFAGKPMYPIKLDSISQDLKETHWGLLETEDLSDEFINWYDQFLQKLYQQKAHLESKFSKEDIEQVNDSFSYFSSELKTSKMGGVVIYARRMDQ